MASLEVAPLRSHIFIPENKQSAWVYKQGTDIIKDHSKEHQGVWAFPNFTIEGKSPVEVWVFRDNDKLGIPKTVLQNNPLQGSWGYSKSVVDPRKVSPNEMIFYPPDSKIPKSFPVRGVWVKPVYKRDTSGLQEHSAGFLTVSGTIAKGDKNSVGGTWRMLGHNDDVVRGKKKQQKGEEGGNKRWIIYVRTPKKVVFPLNNVIPGTKITQCKDKIFKKKGIPREDQRLFFEGVPLKDEKTLVGSGVRNGDTIDLGPMEIFVRTPKGRKFLFEVDHDEAVEDVKKMAATKVDIPVQDQRLFFKRVPMKDGTTLAKYNVRHRNVLDLGGMIIYVEPLKGPTIELDVEPLDTIMSVKTKVKNRIRMPPEDQHLFFKGTPLTKNDATLTDYNIQHLDTLVMRQAPPKPQTSPKPKQQGMIIFVVKDWDNKKFQLTVQPDNNILDIKDMIEARENIPVEAQILTFKRKPVYDEKTLKDSGIKNKSVLHLEEKQITVQLPDGNTTNVGVNPTDPIDKIRDIIEKDHDIPKDDQLLWLRNKPLDPTTPINDYDIPEGEPVVVKTPEPPKVTIKPPKGRPFDVILDPDDTVKDLKQKIGPKINTLPRKFQLIPDDDPSAPLEDDQAPVPGQTYIPIPHAPKEITVKTPTGRNFALVVDPDDTIKDVKKKLVKPTGFPLKHLRLVDDHGDEPEDDSQPLAGIPYHVEPPVIEIEFPNKKKVSLPILPKQTIGDIKDTLEKESGIPKSNQRVFFLDQDTELEDDQPVFRTGIEDGSKLEVRLPPPEPKEITVKTPRGRSFVLTIDPDEPVPSVKRKIAKTVGVPLKNLRLTTDDDEPVDNDTKLSNGDVLTVEPPTIDIVLPDKSRVQHPFSPTDTIKDIKDLIEANTGIPSSKQRIFHLDEDDDELDNDTPLSKTRVKPGEELQVRLPEKVEVPVKTPGGRSFVLVIDPDDTVDDVKRKANNYISVPPKDMRLTVNDEEIDDEFDFSRLKKNDVLMIEPKKLEVELPDLSRVSLPILPSTTIRDVKDMIEEKSGIPKANQRIFFLDEDGMELDDETPIKDTGLPIGDSMKMRLPNELEINMKTPDGRNFILVIDPDDSPEDVTQKAANYISVPPEDIRITWDDDKEIDDEFDFTRMKKNKVLLIEPKKIDVELPNRARVTLPVLPGSTIEDVKDMIEDETGVPKTNQRIFFIDEDPEELDDKTPLKEAGIPLGKALQMQLPDELKINMKTPNGRDFVLTIVPDDTVEDVKRKAANYINVPPEDIRISWNDVDEIDDEFDFSRMKKNDVLMIDPKKIDVELPNRPHVSLSVLPTTTIRDIKDMIEDETGIPTTNQRFFFLDEDGKDLDDETPLKRAGIPLGKALQMQLPDEMEINMRTPNGRNFVLTVVPDDSVEDVKRKAANYIGIPPEDIRMSWNDDGDEIDDVFDFFRMKKSDVVMIDPKKIDIELPNRPHISLSVLPTTTMRDIKDMIEEETNIPTAKQRIFFLDEDGKELDDDIPLRKTGLHLGTALQMMLPEKLEIPVVAPNGRNFVLYIDPDDTVSEFKRELARLGIPNTHYRLLDLHGEEMDDDTPISNLRIRKGEVFQLQPPNIQINLPDRSRIELQVLPTQTMADIKELIESEVGLPKSNHRFLILDAEGNEVDDDIPVSKTEFIEGCTMEIQEIPTEQEITFRSKDGRTFVLTIVPEDTVGDVRRKLQKLGIPVGGFMLDDIEFDDLDDDDLFLDSTAVRPGVVLSVEPPEVEIELPGVGQKIRMAILPTTTIADIKKVVEAQIPEYKAKKQRLFFFDNDDELDDNTPFTKLELKNGLRLEVRSFEIFVEHWDGEATIIDVETTEYMDDVRHKVLQKLNVPVENQRLTFEGHPVREDLNLKEQGLQHRSTLVLEPFRIVVVEPSSKRHTLFVSVDDTIRSLKKRLSKKSKIPAGIQCIMSGGEELQNKQTLAECGVQYDDVLILDIFMVYIMDWLGEVHTLDGIEPHDTVDTLKSKIKKESKVSRKRQRLTLNGAVLREGKTLKSEGVKHKSIIVLEDPNSNDITLPDSAMLSLKIMKAKKFNSNEKDIWPVLPDWKKRIFFFDNEVDEDGLVDLTIMHWTGKNFTLRKVHLGDNIDDLKQRIFASKGIPVKMQRITFEDKLLNPKMSLRQQMVKHKSVLVLKGKRKRNIAVPDTDKVSFGLLPTRIVTSIEIKVKHWTGDKFTVRARPTDYIDDVRETILKLHDIPIEQQHLLLKGEPVNETDSLQAQGIADGTTLVLDPMRIRVETPTGNTLTLTVEMNLTIRRIKKMIFKKARIAVDVQCIMFGGDELTDKTTLADCGVDRDDVLVVEVFSISIMPWSGEMFNLARVKPNDTVEAVMTEILNMKHISTKRQKLSFHGKELERSKTLEEEEVKHKSVIILEEIEPAIKAAPRKKIDFMAGLMGGMEKSVLSLTIQHWNGETFRIRCDANEYLDDIKEKVLRLKKVPVEQQRLLYKGMYVRDDAKLKDQKIENNSTLELEGMRVFVIVPDGKKLHFEVEAGDTIRKLKKFIASKGNVKVDDQCILLGGQELDNKKTLEECGVNHDEVLKMEVFKITVMHWSGKPFDLEGMHPFDTIASVKDQIMNVIVIPKEHLELSYLGNPLKNQRTLEEEGIKHKSVLVLERIRDDLGTLESNGGARSPMSPSLAKAKAKYRVHDSDSESEMEVQPVKITPKRSSPKKWWEKASANNANGEVTPGKKKDKKIVFKSGGKNGKRQ